MAPPSDLSFSNRLIFSELHPMTQILVPRQFRGPPVTANGGYICGLLTKAVGGKGSAMLRAGVPLDTTVELVIGEDGAVSAVGAEGQVLGVARPGGDDQIPTPPTSPGIEAARAASAAS
ncbi:MAG: hypothetical protein CMJ17_16230, partial [Phenylobacterium sp.]|nr:hypothetical protein [Phenylobacterium sp.]